MAQFVVMIGETIASQDHSEFEEGSSHPFVALEYGNDVALAQQAVTSQLLTASFSEVIFHKLVVVSAWRRFLPTVQGREIRRVLRSGSNVMIFTEDDPVTKAGA